MAISLPALKWAAALTLAAAFVAGPLGAQDSTGDAGFLRWARRHAVDLPPVNAPYQPGALRGLGDVIGAARVVALGEPVHLAHEPLAFRNRLVRYLVEQRGFTAVALESGLSQSARLNDFVLGGPGDLAALVGEDITWGFGSLLENRELVAWLRRYNADSTHARKVRFYGVDLPGGTYDTFAQARRAVDDAVAYVARVDSTSAQPLAVRLEPFLDRGFTVQAYSSLTAAERDALTAAIADLGDLLRSQRFEYAAASSELEYQWALRNAVVARQVDAFFGANPWDSTSGRASMVQDNLRDIAMAENLQWVLKLEGPSGRVLLFAHNAHVVNNPIVAPEVGRAWSTMGRHLRMQLGTALVVIATTAHEVTVFDEGGVDSTSLDAVLAGVGRQAFALDLRGARSDSEAVRWMGQRQRYRMNGTFEDFAPRTAADVIVYMDSLTPSTASGLPSIGLALVPILNTHGVQAAIARYRAFKAESPPRYDFGERELNTLGYWLLGTRSVRPSPFSPAKRGAEAVEILKLNVEMFPNGFNTYDSLGEAYLAQGDTARAIANYRRSVELNPNNWWGIRVLVRLGAWP